MGTMTLVCCGCGEPFEKRIAEVNRQRKRNPDHPFYCSRQCYGEHGMKGNCRGPGNPENLRAGNRQDKFSSFRYYMKKAKSREHKDTTDLDLEYLRNLWKEQEGRCALSGVVMSLPRNTLVWEQDRGNPWKPSLDRIDSNKGYLRGNVRFITVMANLCKQSFSDEEVIAFCRAVVSHHGG